MFSPLRRWKLFTVLTISFFVIAFNLLSRSLDSKAYPPPRRALPQDVDCILHPGFFKPKFRWRNVKQRYPVQHFEPIPTGTPVQIPRIQYDFKPEGAERAAEQKRRLRAVEEAFKHSWEGYKRNAWLQDEVSPLSGASRNPFGGWGATLVDTLDTLYIMGMKKEFSIALSALKRIDFAATPLTELNIFETTIRYLGGLLSAYDLSGHRLLLQKAIEVGDLLYLAFDTPNRMPVTRWRWADLLLGKDQEAKKQALLAEVGSLSLEFTRLSQLTGDPRWYDAIARITNAFEESQNRTKIPGLWPTMIDTRDTEFTKDSTFTIGGMADSIYEYLPKQHILLGGQTGQYRNLYLTALPAVKKHIFFRPLNLNNDSMLLPGTVKRYSAARISLQPVSEHLGCFAGGMVALGAKVFSQAQDLETARELVEGCYWAYQSTPTGIMPELFSALPCPKGNGDDCGWDEIAWQKAVVEKAHRGYVPDDWADEAPSIIKQRKLAPGITEIQDARYILRPEAIESVFVLYRITGDVSLQDKAWNMFQAINEATKTPIAHAALKDVRQLDGERELLDNMESFWTAETLKYFYLIFSDPSLVSLDEFVFNTEAHPLRRPQ